MPISIGHQCSWKDVKMKIWRRFLRMFGKRYPGDALRAAEIKPRSPTEYLTQSFPHLLVELNNGRIDDQVAERLARATGISKGFWENLQEAYDG